MPKGPSETETEGRPRGRPFSCRADITEKEPRMPKLVTNDDLKDTLTKFRERGDAWWLKRSEAEEFVSDAIDSNVGPLTMEELEEVLEELE